MRLDNHVVENHIVYFLGKGAPTHPPASVPQAIPHERDARAHIERFCPQGSGLS